MLSTCGELKEAINGLLCVDYPSAEAMANVRNLVYAILEDLKSTELAILSDLDEQKLQRLEELNRLMAFVEKLREEEQAKNTSLASDRQENVEVPVVQEVVSRKEVETPSAEEVVPDVEAKESVSANVQPDEKAAEPAEVKSNRSLHELLEKQNLADFRKAFSLNDRFRFRRELFHGDEALMNQVVEDLNQITSLDEALKYINVRLAWDLKEAAAADFVKLLEKRYI